MDKQQISPNQVVYPTPAKRRIAPRFSLRTIFLLLIASSLLCGLFVWRRSRMETIEFLEAKGYLVYSANLEPRPNWQKPPTKGWEDYWDRLQRWWYRPWGNRIRKLGDYEWIENVKPSYGQPSLTSEEIASVLKALPSLVSIQSLNDDWWSDPRLRERLLKHKSLTSLSTQCLNYVPSNSDLPDPSSALRSLHLFVSKQESLSEVANELGRCRALENLFLGFSAESRVSLQGIGQLQKLTALDVQNNQWPKSRGVGERAQALREPTLSIDTWEKLKELRFLKLSQTFLEEPDWNRVLQLPKLERVHLLGCGSPNSEGISLDLPSGVEITFEIVSSNPMPWDRLSPSPSLKTLELSYAMVNQEFVDFANRSGIVKIVIQNWSYPNQLLEGTIPMLSSIRPGVSIVMIRDYPKLDESYWQTTTGSEKDRFEQLRFFESWAADQPNIHFEDLDFEQFLHSLSPIFR
ncbi:hypothetical protein SH501x_005151 [Pirellulaceae bacterium SH501]